ncbi:hypothetical protein KA183_08435 [bacterium]|nr:hypothetical protein [bacterium]
MRILYPLLLLLVIGIVGTALFWSNSAVDTANVSEAFLQAVEAGNYRKAVKQFGGNACQCPAKGGWVSYLVYLSSQEPNLAFMMKHPFSTGEAKSKAIPATVKSKTPIPWEVPEDFSVDVPIKFDKEYEPKFLPLKMAYGIIMKQAEFDQFLADPDKDSWQAFSLRLRPSLAKGVIDRPPTSFGIEYHPKELAPRKVSGEDSDDSFVYARVEDTLDELLTPEEKLYLHPKDAAGVVDDKGGALDFQKVEESLPKLMRCTLRLHVVRRGQLNKWTVYHFAILDPVFKTASGSELAFKNYQSPMRKSWTK